MHLAIGSLLFAVCATTALAQSPDLTIGSFDRSGVTENAQLLTFNGTLDVVIDNVGSAPTPGTFTVIVYLDNSNNGVFEPFVDPVLGAMTAGPLAAGASTTLTFTVAGREPFRGGLIWAFVDSGDSVVESDEDNNVGNTGDDCTFTPTGAAFPPMTQWSWTSSTTEPTALNVLANPCVVDLDGDLSPEVLFGSTDASSGASVLSGFLRCLEGDTGVERFTVTDPLLRINVTCALATGDIDQDGRPEILACGPNGDEIIAFEDDGTFKWRTSTESINNGAISIADIDTDGDVEIVVGRQAFDHLGNLLWTGTGHRGIAGIIGPVSLVADVDLDGMPEIVAGAYVYSNTGVVERFTPTLGDGPTAVGNFDGDPQAEVVVATSGSVVLLDDDSSLLWIRPVAGGGLGGPPSIADFVAGGAREIGVAGSTAYTVYDELGNTVWSTPIGDTGTNLSGSSVFDLDGDGTVEVVYGDETTLRVLRGSDGVQVWSTPLSRCSRNDYPIVADLDLDGHAEILAFANDNCGFGPQRGVFAYASPTDAWAATRPIWNQHTYHVTNVDDDGTIPRFEDDNWVTPIAAPLNDYHRNLQGGNVPFAAPDLTASRLMPLCQGNNNVTVRVGNGGSGFAPAGVQVAFFDGDPSTGGTLLGTVATPARIAPGESRDVSLDLGGSVPVGPVFALVDDDGTGVGRVDECDESNNMHSQAVCMTIASSSNYGNGLAGTNGVPTLQVSSAPQLGNTVAIEVGNSWGSPTSGCVLVGFQAATIPTQFGGDLLVAQIEEQGLPLSPIGGSLLLEIPCEASLCGGVLRAQAVVFDPGAPAAIAFSRGLEIVLGR